MSDLTPTTPAPLLPDSTLEDAPPPPNITRFARQWSRLQRRVLVAAAAVMLTVGMTLLFLLAQATSNLQLHQDYYHPLVLMNGLVALLLLIGISWGLLNLWQRWRRGRFGSRLLVLE